VGLTGGIAWGIVKQKLADHDKQFDRQEKWNEKVDRILDDQVGEVHCERYRETCSRNICAKIGELKTELKDQGKWSRDKIDELSLLLMKR
jgi:hypothetical protein